MHKHNLYENGYLSTVQGTNIITEDIFTASTYNERGQITAYTLGNQLATTRGYNDFGMPTLISTPGIQNLQYDFDAQTGNLKSRTDVLKSLPENFTYDDLLKNRLETWKVNTATADTVLYEANGNIDKKSGLGSYIYDQDNPGVRPHAVTEIENSGNIVNTELQDITYTPFNKVEIIEEGDYRLVFTYGPDNSRKKTDLYKLRNKKWNWQKTKYFVSGGYELEVEGVQQYERHLHYIYGGDGLAAIFEMDNNNPDLYYIHKDHLGSYQSITDNNGAKVDSLSFDPWGRRRSAVDWSFTSVSTDNLFGRGFTGHEHLPEFNLININGRVYDPILGRFLSPDNYVQLPDYSQSLNRYAYALNNPLIYTDPSGEIIFTIAAAIFCPVLLPVAIGADIGWMTGGIRGANDPDVGFWKGAGRGAAVGAVGGALSMVGGAGMTFAANLALGAGSGAITGGLDAALWGNDIGKGMLWGAAAGAVFTTLTSENFSNILKGEGFYTNENVFNNMIDRGMDKQAMLDYFGFEGTYTGTTKGPNYVDGGGKGTSFFGSTNPKTGSIKYGDLAFDSYDKLNMTYNKEMYHSLRVKNGIPLETQATGMGKHLKYYPEERQGFIHAYKNQGLYPSAAKGTMGNISFYQSQSFNLNPSQYYNSKWWHLMYKIPRRW